MITSSFLYSAPDSSLMTCPAIRRPATGGTNEILPGMDLLAPGSSPVSLPLISSGFSLEYNTFRCRIPRCFSSRIWRLHHSSSGHQRRWLHRSRGYKGRSCKRSDRGCYGNNHIWWKRRRKQEPCLHQDYQRRSVPVPYNNYSWGHSRLITVC